MTDIKLNEPQNEFLFNLMDECDTLLRYVNDWQYYDEDENEFGDIDADVVKQVKYIQFAAECFLNSLTRR